MFVLDYKNNWYDLKIQFEIQLFKSYIEDTENSIKNSILRFESKVKTELIEYDGFHYSSYDYYLNLDSQSFDLKEVFNNYLPNLKRQSVFIAMCSFIEKELFCLCINFNENNSLKFPSNISKLHSIKQYLGQKNINFTHELNSNWETLKYLYSIRNQVVHNFGKANNSNKTIAEVDIQVDENGYFIISKETLEFTLKLFEDISNEIQTLIRFNSKI